jgi:hypothetical protein
MIVFRGGSLPKRARLRLFLGLLTIASACSQGGYMPPSDMGRRDMHVPSLPGDMRTPMSDGGSGVRDLGLHPSADLGVQADLAAPADLSMPMPADLSMPVTPDMSGAKPPCLNGVGWAAFRFKYEGSTDAIVDAFGLPDDSNWEADAVYPTSFETDPGGGGIEIADDNYILIRFSLVGLSVIRSATLSMYGRSFSVDTDGSFDAWSPLYGDIASSTDSVSNAWPYAWTAVDYTANVHVGDPKDSTGIEFKPGPDSDDLLINTVELCMDAD